MSEVIKNLNEFLNKKYKIISIGISPSGHIHPGFLFVLCVGLFYLKKNPDAKLNITNCDMSRPTNIKKHRYIPLSYRAEGNQMITQVTHNELKNFVGLVCNEFDAITRSELINERLKEIENQLRHIEGRIFLEISKDWLDEITFKKLTHKYGKEFPNLKEIEIYKEGLIEERKKISVMNPDDFIVNRVYISKFSDMIKQNPFRNRIIQILKDEKKSAEIVNLLEGNIKSKPNPREYKVPLYGICPVCKRTVESKLKVVLERELNLAFEFICEDKGEVNCPNKNKATYYGLDEGIDLFEYDFLFDPIRDIYGPMKSDCHLFGGDYDENVYKIQKITSLVRRVTDKNVPDYFITSTIMNGDKKLSKSDFSLPLSFDENAKMYWKRIIKILFYYIKNQKDIPENIQANELFASSA
jgi:hypothetical protein